LKADGEKAFLLIPLPVKQSYTSNYSNNNNNKSSYTAPRSAPATNVYYQQADSSGGGGPCFGETSTVLIGEQKVETKVKDVRKGDKMVVADGFATVKCVIRITRDASKSLMSFPGGLTITKRHPIRLNGKWTQPCMVTSDEVANPAGCVYNFVLDRSHIPLINGIECCTWGHGFTATGVAHPYYGS